MNKKWYAVMTDRDDNDWGMGSFDRGEAEKMVVKNLDIYPDGYVAVIDGEECVDEIMPEDFNGVVLGKWQDTDIDVVYIDGQLYALDGWNGEKYLHCWKCIDRFTANPDGREYEVTPIYDWSKWNEDDEQFQDENGVIIDGVIGYEVA